MGVMTQNNGVIDPFLPRVMKKARGCRKPGSPKSNPFSGHAKRHVGRGVGEDTGHWELLELARLHGRLLVILDGFDEAGHLERASERKSRIESNRSESNRCLDPFVSD